MRFSWLRSTLLLLMGLGALVALVAIPRAETRADDTAPSAKPVALPSLAAVLNDDSLIIVRVATGNPQTLALVKELLQLLPPGAVPPDELQVNPLQFIADAGIDQLYLVLSPLQLTDSPVFLVHRPGKADQDATLREKMRLGAALRVGDWLLLGMKAEQLTPYRNFMSSLRPDLEKAHAETRDALVSVIISASPTVRTVFEQISPEMPQIVGGGPITTLTKGLESIRLTIASDPARTATLTIAATSPEARDQLGKLISTVGQLLLMQDLLDNGKPFLQANPKAALLLMATLQFKRQGNSLVLQLPAIQSAARVMKELFPTDTTLSNTRIVNHFKQIALAYHSFHDVYGVAASNLTDKAGKPLLSWRVLMLPYLEQQALYNQFKLDEPWDSPNNKPLIEKMPEIFASPGVPNGKTIIQRPTGKSLGLDPTKPRLSLRDFTDGTSNTILLVEMPKDQAVIWTKPDDWTPTGNDWLTGFLKGRPDSRIVIGMTDGSVRRLPSKSFTNDILKAMLTRNGGEVVDLP
ncbi:DUF1559 family PulG-like putative transporter [Tuwongella immobilis]|uniref:DUF1559 domain-containing protein n=1 Tax=Tuwongella immobilis TaxID=692036 RepID=A0A6C2YU49_9BACT|nr:DUF1559 domain-containing protein [Tuwongella immobilis]VIP04877.1 Uncharacterized protein OS=Singulisphaera acidiphila (strain ATCC BAA-1392 / DSM 18658 / VKM B-2454 / MOB10) GN=Sinac_0934 PE=4 SV=1: SBP_bac_10: SBP_bac_10 [Tuwongella immobilis]VTS07113.1 Uncharacterized protein OS=Singulisphaera acidiphila (strain ATCC BAA-1392 / DSM 18658 / VKM B-2454 / MOB10) GN=Sinac_0934 PE=4 SV=1: SBP_bac_10: SBP_bac_10 [Tuwongella immobilis]